MQVHDWTRSAVCKWWKETQPGCAGPLGVALRLSTSTSMLTPTETTHSAGHTAFNANGINQVCVVLGVFAGLFMYEQDVEFAICELELMGILFLGNFYLFIFLNVYICEPKYLSARFLFRSESLVFCHVFTCIYKQAFNLANLTGGIIYLIKIELV